MQGPRSILDCIGHTPLVPLVRVLPRASGAQSSRTVAAPFGLGSAVRVARGVGVPVFAKCEHLNPGGSVKDRIALAIIDAAERSGELERGATLIEATAGNTGVGLALVAAVRGYRLVCVMPEKMSEDKRAALRSLGAEVVITKNAPHGDPENFRVIAERLAAERGWFLTRQFENLANVRAHEEGTGPEILEQTGGHIAAFVCGAGTGGTITGVGRFLKARVPGIRVVLADPVGSLLAAHVRGGEIGPDAPFAVEGIGGSVPPGVLDLSIIDEAEEVSDDESFAMVHRLLREEGLLVGGSAGTAVVAALRVAARVDGPVVTILPDGWDRYRSKPWMSDSR